MAARWRKQPSEKGLARVCQGPRGYELYEDGKLIMWVFFASSRYGHNDKWYWVGLGRNTAGTPEMFDTKEQARDAATAYYKAHKKRSAIQCLSSQAGKG